MYKPYEENKVYTIEQIKKLADDNIIYKVDGKVKVLYGDRENFERIVFDKYNEVYDNLFEVSHREDNDKDNPYGDIYEEPSAYEII